MDFEENSAQLPAVWPKDSGRLLWGEDHNWTTAEEQSEEHSLPPHFAYWRRFADLLERLDLRHRLPTPSHRDKPVPSDSQAVFTSDVYERAGIGDRIRGERPFTRMTRVTLQT